MWNLKASFKQLAHLCLPRLCTCDRRVQRGCRSLSLLVLQFRQCCNRNLKVLASAEKRGDLKREKGKSHPHNGSARWPPLAVYVASFLPALNAVKFLCCSFAICCCPSSWTETMCDPCVLACVSSPCSWSWTHRSESSPGALVAMAGWAMPSRRMRWCLAW